MGTSLQVVETLSPGRNLDAYMQSVTAIPVLSVEEERSLGERLHFDGDVEAARRMVMSHLRFVVHVAKTYSGYGLPLGDLIQEGNVGLMKAVKRFDPTMGVRLVSFADPSLLVEDSNWEQDSQRRLMSAMSELDERSKDILARRWLTDDKATLHELAAEYGVSAERIRQLEKNAMKKIRVSMEA